MFSQHVKICLLLTIFTFFWCWQIAEPLLDSWLASIHIGHLNASLYLPVSEALSQYLCAATILSGYTLYSTINYSEVTFKMNAIFIFASFMVASGHGVHVATVIIQKQMTSRDPLYALVHFLHEYWSHNMFVGGFYCLVFLLIWAEDSNNITQRQTQDSCTKANECNTSTCRLHNLDKDTDLQCNTTPPESNQEGCRGTSVQECGHLLLAVQYQTSTKVNSEAAADCDQSNGSIPVNNNYETNGVGSTTNGINETLARATPMPRRVVAFVARCIVLWTTRAWPVLLGVYFSAFASMTTTKPIAMVFYIGVLLFQTRFIKELSFSGLLEYLRRWESDMVVSGFFTKAVLIGSPLLLFDFE